MGYKFYKMQKDVKDKKKTYSMTIFENMIKINGKEKESKNKN